jgi:hypothetical protein
MLSGGPLTADGLTGNLWFSKQQFAEQRAKGFDRTFAKLLRTGEIVEYTELITLETLREDPGAQCLKEDGMMVGQGIFHHFKDKDGYDY